MEQTSRTVSSRSARPKKDILNSPHYRAMIILEKIPCLERGQKIAERKLIADVTLQKQPTRV